VSRSLGFPGRRPGRCRSLRARRVDRRTRRHVLPAAHAAHQRQRQFRHRSPAHPAHRSLRRQSRPAPVPGRRLPRWLHHLLLLFLRGACPCRVRRLAPGSRLRHRQQRAEPARLPGRHRRRTSPCPTL
ncbi:MAG: Fluoride ion transporter CrcB, partial [uncultured Chloroflexi bacterium]